MIISASGSLRAMEATGKAIKMFSSLYEIAYELAERSRRCTRLKKVLISSATNSSQIYSSLEAAMQLPCAICCVGDIEYSDSDCDRTVRPVVVVADKFRPSLEKRSSEIWILVEELSELLMDNSFSNFDFEVVSVTPIESDDKLVSAYALTLKYTEPSMEEKI